MDGQSENKDQDAGISEQGFIAAAEKQDNTDVEAVSVPAQDENQKPRANYWLIGLLLGSLALLLTLSIDSLKNEAKLKHEVQDQMAEIEKMKRNFERAQQQSEIMQRERDAALEKARQEEKQHALEAQAAAEASRREQEAKAAAALAAEEALKAAREAEESAKKQRLEQKKLSKERKRLQLEKQKAEREKQRLAQERRQAELEKERLARERLAAEKRAQREKERLAAKKQAELVKSLQQDDSAKAEAGIDAGQKTQKKPSSFKTDPCSTPSAKFLSTCK